MLDHRAAEMSVIDWSDMFAVIVKHAHTLLSELDVLKLLLNGSVTTSHAVFDALLAFSVQIVKGRDLE